MRTPMMKFLALSGVGLFVFGTAVLVSEPDSANDSLKTAPNDLEREAKALVASCQFELGDSYSWSMTSEDRAEVDLSVFGIPSDGMTTIANTTRASFHARVVRVSESDATLFGQFADVDNSTLKADGELERPFLFKVSKSCSLEGFAYDPASDPGLARVQQAFLYDLAWAVPVREGEIQKSENTFGSVVATVESNEFSASSRYVKTFKSLAPWTEGPGQPSTVDSGSLVVTRTDGWFDTATIASVYIGFGTTVTRSVNVARVDARPVASDVADVDLSSFVWANLLPLDLAPDGSGIARADRAPRPELEGRDLDSAMAEHAAEIANEVPVQQSWTELRDFLEANPHEADNVVARLKAGEIPTEARMATYIALGNAATPEARRALEGIMDDSAAPPFERIRAMLNLIDRQDVGIELGQSLAGNSSMKRGQGQAEHMVARHSIMALGAMSARKPDNAELRELASSTVAQALTEHRDPEVLGPVYKAFANIGDASKLIHVEDIVLDPDYQKRIAGAVVTRRMDPRDTAEFTRRWLETEQDWRVKEAIYMTLEKQTYTAQRPTSADVMRLALRDLREGPTVITRKAIVRLLGRAELEKSDPLYQEIQDTFVSILPREVSTKSGLYLTLANEIDSPKRIREALASLHTNPPAGSSGTSPVGPVSGPNSSPEVAQ